MTKKEKKEDDQAKIYFRLIWLGLLVISRKKGLGLTTRTMLNITLIIVYFNIFTSISFLYPYTYTLKLFHRGHEGIFN